MKKQLLVALATVFVLALTTTATAQVRFGVKAGLNLANQTFDNFGEIEPQTTFLPTFMVGGIVEFGFSENLGISTGLELQGKGFALDEEDDNGARANPLYIQIPVHLQYLSDMGLLVSGGPYVGFGVAGSIRDIDENSTDIEFGSDLEDDYNPLDFGVGLKLGYEMPMGLRIMASYDLGLANLVPSDVLDLDDEIRSTHSVIGISLGYMFGGRE